MEQAKIKLNAEHLVSADAEQFYSDFWVESSELNEQSLEHKRHILGRFFPDGLKNQNILEVGVGGEGGLIYLLKDLNRVYGYDVSDAAVRNCQKLGLNVSKINMDRERLNFENSTFDIIFALEVFEHFSNPQHALEELKRVLKPGGILLISTPAPVVYHWPRLFYPSLFESDAFGKFLMVNGFNVDRYDNDLRVNLLPVSEKQSMWGWYWKSYKLYENDYNSYIKLGDYFWNQVNEFGIRHYPIEAIDLYRNAVNINNSNVEANIKLTYALLYRAINGDTEFNDRFESIRLNNPDFTDEEAELTHKIFIMILLESEKLGYPIVSADDMMVVRKSAIQLGIIV